jgi:glutamate-1-semialdehyde aminotransferase
MCGNRLGRLYEEINGIMKHLGFMGHVQGKGARFSFLFGPIVKKEGLRNYRNIVDNQWELLNRFYKACFNHGIFIHTMQHHGISSAHSDEDIDRALEGNKTALLEIMAEGLNT